MKNLVVIGSSGLGRETLWVAQAMNEVQPEFNLVGFLDEDQETWGETYIGSQVLGSFEWLDNQDIHQLHFVCGIGNTRVRRQVADRVRGLGGKFATLVHPAVVKSASVEIGAGSVIAAGTILTTEVSIGDHVFLNLDCTVGHNAILESYVNCAPSCNISGDVTLKEGAHLGTGAQVIQGLTVGSWTRIGAGTVVLRDLPSKVTAVGVPARILNK